MSLPTYRMKLKKILTQQYDQSLQEMKQNVDRIIKHKDTTKVCIDDFPSAKQHLLESFPNVDISDIPIYLTPPKVMTRNGFKECMGCYIPALKIIITHNGVSMDYKCTNAFNQKLQDAIKTHINIEDVVIHEMLHAISHKMNRPGRKFVFNEEEFVYTNCVDFYRNNTQTDDEIVSGIMLPFCVNDIMADKAEMSKICKRCNIELDQPFAKIKKLFNEHSDDLVIHIVAAAKKRAEEMIHLYEKYGRRLVNSNIAPSSNVASRIQSLDMDCEI